MNNEPVRSSDENISENKAAETSAEETAEVKALSDNEVTAHTSSLWKYNPIPEKPEKYPEYRHSYSVDPDNRLSVTAARVRGKMHKHDGTNCDDWYEYDFGGGMAFAAVADGAGSKLFSRIGAKTACEAAVKVMKQEFTGYFNKNTEAVSYAARAYSDPEFNRVCSELAGMIQNAAAEAAKAVEDEAEKRRKDKELIEAARREPELTDFSATLLIAAVIPVISEETGSAESLVISVQIGDGMIAAVNADGEYSSALSLMGAADSGEFSGETDFITTPKMKTPEALMKRTKITRRPCTHVMLMSDGVADDYFPNNPEMLRLFMDLSANGVIPAADAEITDVNRPYISKIPRPEKNIWVNDNDVTFEYQYISKVCEETGLSSEQLWSMPDVAAAASLRSFGIEVCSDPSEQLEKWLDNYVRRGSFDDRTLLIIGIDNTLAGKGQDIQ